MAKIYRLKEDVDLNEFAKRGYDYIPQTLSLVKIIKQPENGEAVIKLLLEKFYLNKDWIEKVYNGNKKEIQNAIGLRYYQNGDIKYTKKLKMVLTDWRIEIEEQGDRWLAFKSLDPFDFYSYYGKDILDEFCKKEIDELLELGLIEEYEVSANEGGYLEQ